VTEDSDALAVIVSEETGYISVAHHGRLIRNLDQERLRRVLRSLAKIDRPLRPMDTAAATTLSRERVRAILTRLARSSRQPKAGSPRSA